MKNIDYKRLRRYDIGKEVDNNTFNPLTVKEVESTQQLNDSQTSENLKSIGSGVSDFIQTGRNTGLFNQIGNLFSPASSLSSAAQVNSAVFNAGISSGSSALTNAAINALPTTLSAPTATTSSGLGGFLNASQNAISTTSSVGSSASSAVGTAAKFLPFAGIAAGAYNMFNTTLDATKTVDDNLISQMSGKTLLYVDGKPYYVNTGVNARGLRDYVNKLNTGNFFNTVLGDTGMGASIGSLFPAYGTAIGTAVGFLEGIGRGLTNIFIRNNKANKAIENATIAADNSNRQAFTEARTNAFNDKIVKANKGLSPNNDAPNGMIQGGEPVVAYEEDKDEVKWADMFQITEEHPERVDNILVKLDQGNTRHAVLGNKIDPRTGERFAVEGRPYVFMANSSNPNEAEIGKQVLKDLVDTQNSTPNVLYADQGKGLDKLTWVSDKKKQEYMTRANKQDMIKYTKSLPKYDLGKANWYSIIPGVLGAGLSGLSALTYYKQKPSYADTSASNPYLNKALELMPSKYDPSLQLTALNNITRQSMYGINKSPYGAGQRMAMLSTLYGDKMKNTANILDNAEKITNEYSKDKALAYLSSGESQASRYLNANQYGITRYDQLSGDRNKGVQTHMAGGLNNLFSMFGNLVNNMWTNENIKLWRENLKYQLEKDRQQSALTPTTPTTPTPIDRSTQERIWELNRLLYPVKNYTKSSRIIPWEGSMSDFIANFPLTNTKKK